MTALGGLLAEGLTASDYRDGCPVATVVHAVADRVGTLIEAQLTAPTVGGAA
ncbi:hypothetical protein ABT381_31035 [Streptomyces sp. NPDC000151]|uniref:hypothetical protein n=1 Tax=Streptomyces sp. NPDC000151 TaxID=3154244 RepID=UPI00331A1021